MPNSKLSTFVIDCPTEDLEAAATFWSQALGRGLKPPQPGDDRYRTLAGAPSEPILMIQKVTHEGRIHLDIESDDIDAEVARLEQLGAKRLERVRTWVIMQAPTGQRFCVVRPQRPSSEPPFPKAGAPHALLQQLVGSYRGQVRTFLDPNGDPDVAEGELHVTAIAGGRWLRIEQLGSVAGTAHTGELLLGFHNDAKEFEACWVDSFHTGTAMMASRGPLRPDGVIAITGGYDAGRERWGWRTEIHPGTPLTIRAVNIAPDGQEYPGVEGVWTRI